MEMATIDMSFGGDFFGNGSSRTSSNIRNGDPYGGSDYVGFRSMLYIK